MAAPRTLAEQLNLVTTTLLSLEAYLAQARQVIADARRLIEDGESGGGQRPERKGVRPVRGRKGRA
jgi:hypothetical protein